MSPEEKQRRKDERRAAERASWQPYIRAAVAGAPPFTEEQTRHLIRLLRPTP